MNKLIKAFCLTIVLSVCVFAQNTSDEYNRNEFFVGYSNQHVDSFGRLAYNGFEVSVVRNVHRYVGIKGDFSAAYRNDNFTFPAGASAINVEVKRSIYNFLGGIQVKDNASKARFKPFAHALVGVAHNRTKDNRVTCVSNCPTTTGVVLSSSSDTGFGGAFGGGLDIKINDKFDFRAIQIDYNPVYSNRRVDNNIRYGIGIVFK